MSSVITWALGGLLGSRDVAEVRWLYGNSGRESVMTTSDDRGLLLENECVAWIWNDFHPT